MARAIGSRMTKPVSVRILLSEAIRDRRSRSAPRWSRITVRWTPAATMMMIAIRPAISAGTAARMRTAAATIAAMVSRGVAERQRSGVAEQATEAPESELRINDQGQARRAVRRPSLCRFPTSYTIRNVTGYR
jgi:hypothetical protein